jgi:hypothetical protein
MTTLIWFAELLHNTVTPNEATDDLYDGISEQMEEIHFQKWEEI